VLSAGVVYFGTHAMQLTIGGFAAINVGLTLVWITVALLIVRRHRDLTRLSPASLQGAA
jgi:hypothetical protein